VKPNKSEKGNTMQYPLCEDIGAPELFVGREKVMAMLDEWIKRIPKKLAKSKAIFSRKKAGKTALIQRLFNKLWSENGQVIPNLISISDTKIWLSDFAIEYFRVFASQYISFLERAPELLQEPLEMNEIEEYGRKNSNKSLVKHVTGILENESKGRLNSMWLRACSAPRTFASVFDIRFLVMIDEFQFLSKFIYDPRSNNVIESLPGSYHSLSETKVAPMLITGSYTNWLNTIVGKHLEGGRVSKHFFSPYLESDEGLQAVNIYAKVFNKKITEKTAQQINQLCFSDPFFISCVIQNTSEKYNLCTKQGVIDAVHDEISNRESDMSIVWREYIDKTLEDINNIHAKRILLHMSSDPKRVWIPKELKDELHLEISEQDILERLRKLEKADLIKGGNADIEFMGINDGTLHLILRSRYGREIQDFEPDIRVDFEKRLDTLENKISSLEKDKKSLSGQLNVIKGEIAESRLAKLFRKEKRFSLSKFFQNVKDKKQLNIIDVRTNVIVQRDDGKNMEIDIKAESDCGRVVFVEVKKWKKKISINVVKDFYEKIETYSKDNPEKIILPAIWAENGFSKPSIEMCKHKAIAGNFE
jgi:DNA-binding Lrp family transcriptional regulator